MNDSASPEDPSGDLPLPPGRTSPSQTTARQAANRRNPRKSTGPKTIAGKRRSSLNRLRRNLCPADLEREMRALGEDPREFCRLHRDLISIFRPKEVTDHSAVDLMARTWWQKARRIRQSVEAGPAPCDDLDARLEKLLLFLVGEQRRRHEWWGVWLARVLGAPVGSPAAVRRQIESRMFVFGGGRRNRKYPRDRQRDSTPADRAAHFERIFGPILAGFPASAPPPEPVAPAVTEESIAAVSSPPSPGKTEVGIAAAPSQPQPWRPETNSNKVSGFKSLFMRIIRK